MEITNSFNKGLNKDIAKHQYPNDLYYHLENYRLALGDSGETGALANVTGNSKIQGLTFSIPGLFERDLQWSIVGYATIREYLYLFVSVSSSAALSTQAHSAIFKVDITDTTGTLTLIYTDYGTGDYLGLSTSYPIRKAIGNVESDTIHNIYWTDFNSPLRKINVKRSDLLNYQGTGLPMPSALLNIVPDVTLNPPTVDSVFAGGSLTAGIVQYAYCMYNIGGSETKFSPTSDLVHLVESGEFQTNSEQYEGSEIGTNTGKAVQLIIDNPDANYTNIKVVSIQYTELFTEPIISIVADIKRGNVNTIIDDGSDYLGTYTVDEFTTLGGTLFTCKDFEAKDNRLFASNLKEFYYDVDFDARAYRYDGGKYTRINKLDWESANSEVIYAATANNPLMLDGSPIPETHDAICPTNQLFPGNVYNTVWNSNTLGGTGANVSYEFITQSLIEDTSTEPYQLYSPQGAESYENYASPYNNKYKSYQRDEIYAFGIVFINKRGIPSFVKWVGDIRFPNVFQQPTVVYNSGTFYVRSLGIKFTIDIPANILSEIKGFHIVRCKREANDRTVVMQGLTNLLRDTGGDLFIPLTSIYLGFNNATTEKIYDIISPEINFNRTTVPAGSYLEYIGTYGGASAAMALPAQADSFYSVKFSDINENNGSVLTPIQEYKIVGQNDSAQSLSGIDYYPWFTADQYSTKGTSGILTTTNYYALPNDAVCNIRRDIIPYIGNTYADRTNREYFSVAYIPVEEYDANTPIEVYNGDTYIGMYDYLRGADRAAATSGAYGFNIIFPVETSINLALRHDTCIHKIYDIAGSHLLQETANQGLNDYTNYPEDFTDLYLYNSVYSRENDLVKFFPKPLDWVEQKTFDVDTIYSEIKYSGETVDNWTRFLPNSRNSALAQYGPINKLILHKNNLIFFQDSAIGVWYTNVKEVISTNNPGALSVGTGQLLARHDYITVRSGTKHQFSVLGTDDALYYLDEYNGTLNVLSDNPIALSVEKGIASYVKEYIKSGIDNPIEDVNSGITTSYDKEHGECLFTFRKGSRRITLVFSEYLKTFTGIYTVTPRLWILTPNKLLSVPDGLDSIYLHNTGNYGEWYGVPYDSTVTLLVNPGAGKNCMFTKITFNSECETDSKTVNEIQVWNNSQTPSPSVLEVDDNIERRFRTWRAIVPRDDDGNPMRDGHIYLKLLFDNEDNNKFVLYPVTTYFQPAPF